VNAERLSPAEDRHPFRLTVFQRPADALGPYHFVSSGRVPLRPRGHASISPPLVSAPTLRRAKLFLTCGIRNIALIWRSTLERSNGNPIIMDLNGDTRHNFDAKDVKSLLEAERRFKALTGEGFTAATRVASGEPVVTRTFDPTVEETLFFLRLVGG